MTRLTVWLPNPLRRQLADAANDAGVSLNQYMVMALTRQVTLAYTVQPVPDHLIYTALLQSLGTASHDEICAVLDERGDASPERELSPEVVQRLRERLLSRTAHEAT